MTQMLEYTVPLGYLSNLKSFQDNEHLEFPTMCNILFKISDIVSVKEFSFGVCVSIPEIE